MKEAHGFQPCAFAVYDVMFGGSSRRHEEMSPPGGDRRTESEAGEVGCEPCARPLPAVTQDGVDERLPEREGCRERP